MLPDLDIIGDICKGPGAPMSLMTLTIHDTAHILRVPARELEVPATPELATA